MVKSSYELCLEQLREVHFQLGLLSGYFKSQAVFLEYDRKSGETTMNPSDLEIIKNFDKCRNILFDGIYLPIKASIEHSGY